MVRVWIIFRVLPGGCHLIGVRNDERTLEDEAPEEGGVPGDGGHGDHPAHGVAVEEHRCARHPGLDLSAVSASHWSLVIGHHRGHHSPDQVLHVVLHAVHQHPRSLAPAVTLEYVLMRVDTTPWLTW